MGKCPGRHTTLHKLFLARQVWIVDMARGQLLDALSCLYSDGTRVPAPWAQEPCLETQRSPQEGVESCSVDIAAQSAVHSSALHF